MRKLMATLMAGAMLMMAPNAMATLYTLNQSNLGMTGNFATVDLTVSGTTASFNVDADQVLLNAGSNFGIDKFYFNTDLSTITQSDFALNSGWSVSLIQNVSNFGIFEIAYTGPGNRLDPLAFTVTDANIASELNFYQPNADGHHFAAHIGGLSYEGQGSLFVTDGNTPVPEPGTMMLLGMGMLGLAVYGKRRMNKQA